MIKIGFGSVGVFDYKYERTILEIDGQLVFKGKTDIGKGSRICVGKHGILEIGNNFLITAHSTIVCFNHIKIGDHCLFSWENMIMDTDFHHIFQENAVINLPKPIVIGNHVWMGMRCTVLKGTIIADDCIIAANSLVAGNLNTPCAVYGGIPAKILKQNIKWKK
jgi:acetyltransferase-like isoleucine patch superfamily enzyme